MSLRPLSTLCPSVARLTRLTTEHSLGQRCIQHHRRRFATVETSALAEIAIKPSVYGQPLPASHPHLVNEGELTPGILKDEYEHRRRKLMDSLPEGSIVVCVAAQIKYMSGQIFYKFRQSSDFWYLTGFDEPAAALLLRKDGSRRGYHMTLFHSPHTRAQAQWDGARTSTADICDLFGADDARSVEEMQSTLRDAVGWAQWVYVDLPVGQGGSSRRGKNAGGWKSLLQYLSSSSTDPLDALSGSALKRRTLAPEVGRLRAIKSEAEQDVMRRAADISARAHTKTMRFTEPGMSEHAVAAHFEYLCAREGSQRPAYVPVVASGANALTIHYTANNQLIREGELILIDAGCEYNGYASDITRTYPASGTFTGPQADLYAALLTAQKALIARCTASQGLSLAGLHHESVDLIARELRAIGIDFGAGMGRGMGIGAGRASMGEIYPHYVGHPVGIDLHESTHFERDSPMKAGMIVTVEPGVYIPPLPQYPKHFHSIGIRIEDEVLVGKDTATILSVNAPKEIVDVEGACQGILGLEPF